MKSILRRMLQLFLLCASACSILCAQPTRATPVPPAHSVIWILTADGSLSAYDGTNFHLLKKSSSPLPPDARQHPESISISRTGIVLYAKQEPNSGGRPLHWYLWKNGQTYDLLAASREERPAKGNSTLVTSATPVALLGTDARHLFWFENRLSVIQRENEGEISQSGEFRSWTSDLNARNTRQVVSVALPSCKCETAVCEETCPIIDAWAPDRGVSDFFFLTRWIQGQTSSDFLETILYRAAGAVWVPQKLPKPIYEFLDAANGGNTYIAAVPDGGCCGWENESDDITDLARGGGGEQITFFDEFARFHNRDYDVSFFTPKALFSPDASQIAYSITSTYRPGEQIRLADQGRENPRELKQIQNALTDLPRLEVVQIPKLQIRDDVARTGIVQPTNLRPAFSLPNVELIGWLDSRRVLAWQHGELFVINASTGQSAPTGLKAEAASRVFIR